MNKNLSLKSTRNVQEVEVPANFIKIRCPCRMVVAGPSMIGKSRFALKLIEFRKDVFDEKFDRILYALPDTSLHLHQEFIQDLRNICPFVEIVEGLPDVDTLNLATEKSSHKLLIMDDLMSKAFASGKILELVTSTSHHSNI